MREWDYHPTAWRELERAMTKYEGDRNGLGGELLAEVERVLLTNQEHFLPGTTATSGGGDTLRRLLLERFPYALIVDVRPETRLVLAVAHLRRRPGYWRARAPKK
jgi:toxin ParE1/3/4